MAKYRSVLEIHPKTNEVTVTSRSKGKRVRATSNKNLLPGDIIEIINEEVFALERPVEKAPAILEIKG